MTDGTRGFRQVAANRCDGGRRSLRTIVPRGRVAQRRPDRAVLPFRKGLRRCAKRPAERVQDRAPCPIRIGDWNRAPPFPGRPEEGFLAHRPPPPRSRRSRAAACPAARPPWLRPTCSRCGRDAAAGALGGGFKTPPDAASGASLFRDALVPARSSSGSDFASSSISSASDAVRTGEGPAASPSERPSGRCGRHLGAPRFSNQVWQNFTKCLSGRFGSISSDAHQRRHSPSR